MMDKLNTLKGHATFSTALKYDDEKFFFKREFTLPIIQIVLIFLISAAGVRRIILAINQGSYDWLFFVDAVLTSIMASFLMVLIYLLFHYSKRNKRVYSYTEVQHFEANEISKYIKLRIYFTDHSTEKLTVDRNLKSREFLELLKGFRGFSGSAVQGDAETSSA